MREEARWLGPAFCSSFFWPLRPKLSDRWVGFVRLPPPQFAAPGDVLVELNPGVQVNEVAFSPEGAVRRGAYRRSLSD